ncbi:MAG: HlyD family secretion protein [Dyadobacter sp.]|uniref:HlyD family secretion protein n=1 Tax=Dyadobacter sp. TaxID=1914288 RepID=UPI001B1FA42C|nr:HlyD family secretion protein [Dyadobacter sp.]MBO9611171.1 HlyD family secretion protein [Dyadobacter sp.]
MKVRKTPAAHGPFHTTITVIASLIALGGIGLGVWFFIIYSNYEETNDAQVDQYVTPVATRITGYVQQVRYEENQFVHRGDTLIVIDNREYRAHWGVATAEISNARHHVSAARKNAASTQSHVAVGQAQLDAARTLVWKTKLEYERYEALLHEEAATEQQVEKVRADYESAQAHYDEVNRSIRASELATSEALAQVPVAESMIEVRNAAADNAALYLSYTVITAPYDGWVGRKTIQPGQLVKEGQTLVSVVSREKWITANFKETQIADMTVGQPVTFKADASHGRTFNGRIESFSPASGARFSILPPDNSTGNFVKIEQRIPVRIRLIDPGSQTAFLRAGMNVTVTAAHQH